MAPLDLLTDFAIGVNGCVPDTGPLFRKAQRDLLVDFAGEINVLPAALAPGLNDHAADLWLDFIDFYPNPASINSRFQAVVNRVLGNQRAIERQHIFRRGEDLRDGTFVAAFEGVLGKRNARFHMAIGRTIAAAKGYRGAARKCKSQEILFHCQ